MNKIWYITGASRGLGKQWALHALSQGDYVVAAARNLDDLEYMGLAIKKGIAFPVRCDVTQAESVANSIQAGMAYYGNIDVVVNAAGIGMFAPLEDSPMDDVHRVFEVNFFGSWNVIQSMLKFTEVSTPWKLFQISSIAGMRGFADMAAYAASKWAVEGMIESLRDELAGRPVDVCIVQPGPYLTDWVGKSAIRPNRSHRYPGEEQTRKLYWPKLEPEDPGAAASALSDVLKQETQPFRVVIGASALGCWKESASKRASPSVVCAQSYGESEKSLT